MLKNLWEAIKTIDSTIIAALISAVTLFLSLLINFFISRALIDSQLKKDHAHQKRLAFLAPAFQNKLLDTKKFIEQISTSTDQFIKKFYKIPESHMIELVKNYDNPDLESIIIRSLDGEACHKYELLRFKKYNSWQALYFALNPDFLSDTIEVINLFGDYHIRNRLLIPENILFITDKLILEITNTITSLKNEIQIMFVDEDEEPTIIFKKFQNYWIEKNNRWNKYIEEMNKLFLQLWDNNHSASK